MDINTKQKYEKDILLSIKLDKIYIDCIQNTMIYTSKTPQHNFTDRCDRLFTKSINQHEYIKNTYK